MPAIPHRALFGWLALVAVALVAGGAVCFGLAVAILIDATLIRAVLLPATMKLLGDRNWYLPRWLEWLPRLDYERRETVAVEPALALSA